MLLFLIETITKVLLDRFWSEIFFCSSLSCSQPFHMGSIQNAKWDCLAKVFCWFLLCMTLCNPSGLERLQKSGPLLNYYTFESAEVFNIRDFLIKMQGSYCFRHPDFQVLPAPFSLLIHEDGGVDWLKLSILLCFIKRKAGKLSDAQFLSCLLLLKRWRRKGERNIMDCESKL